MDKVRVYRFRYFDRDTGTMCVAPDFATAAAIHDMCGEALVETGRDVDPAAVAQCGLLRLGK
jgi:hypothetical protein